MTAPISIASSDILPDIEHCFRVTAGPGSGKTYWLIEHIRHVASASSRMTPCSRIAVISYTNVAVQQIIQRLKGTADVTDVSTIHSFLFRNIVRPYLHLLKTPTGEDLVAYQLVETHSEHFIARNLLEEWLKKYGKGQVLMRANNLQSLQTHLRSLSVRVDAGGQPYFTPCNSGPMDKFINDLLTPERLLQYKLPYWARGQVSHDDVLYLAHRILAEFPSLATFVSARFPYLFIDEFQDTVPVQAVMVSRLAASGTVVGVIGDPEQAIFGFLDASPLHFTSFALPGLKSYEIKGNRRSTGAIVRFLNRVRTDHLEQEPISNEDGVPPTVLLGDLSRSLDRARADSAHSAGMLVLSRKHKNVLRSRMPDREDGRSTWEEIEEADTDRYRLLHALTASVDLAKRGLFDVAIQELVKTISSRKAFRAPLKHANSITMTSRRAVALSLIEYMAAKHDEMAGWTTLEVYRALTDHVPTCLAGLSMTKATKGKFVDQASTSKYRDLIDSVATADETRLHRTIHQAKGAEADAVFVSLDGDEWKHIVSPKAGVEEQRIAYVALSRAKVDLFIHTPDMSTKDKFAAMGLTVVDIGPSEEQEAEERSSV